jgi:hypothetical protein
MEKGKQQYATLQRTGCFITWMAASSHEQGNIIQYMKIRCMARIEYILHLTIKLIVGVTFL